MTLSTSMSSLEFLYITYIISLIVNFMLYHLISSLFENDVELIRAF